MSEYIVAIPSRFGSTRFPGKALAQVGGMPMIRRVCLQALKSKASKVIACVDDKRIADALEGVNALVCMTDPNLKSGTDRIAAMINIMGLDEESIIVNVQGDEPLIPTNVVREVAELLAAHPECEMATAGHPIDNIEEFLNPNVVKVVRDAQGNAITFSRAPIPWPRDAFREDKTQLPEGLVPLRHIGLYAYRVKFLKRYPQWEQAPIEKWESLEQLRALYYGVKIAVAILPGALPAGVDTQEDLERVREVFARGEA